MIDSASKCRRNRARSASKRAAILRMLAVAAGVIPAQAGNQFAGRTILRRDWFPACAETTNLIEND